MLQCLALGVIAAPTGMFRPVSTHFTCSLAFHSKAINITAAVAAATLSSLVNLSHVLVLNAGTVLFRPLFMTLHVKVEDFLDKRNLQPVN